MIVQPLHLRLSSGSNASEEVIELRRALARQVEQAGYIHDTLSRELDAALKVRNGSSGGLDWIGGC